ncbi:MAG: hypothetical protein U0802_10180 [Candidatus Binatia bacterium]
MSAGAAGGMRLARAARIAAVTIALPLAFRLSQRVGEASGNPPPEGMPWAVGVLGVLFLLRALATELSRGPEADLQKDLQWGIAAGCLLTVLRLNGVLGW